MKKQKMDLRLQTQAEKQWLNLKKNSGLFQWVSVFQLSHQNEMLSLYISADWWLWEVPETTAHDGLASFSSHTEVTSAEASSLWCEILLHHSNNIKDEQEIFSVSLD